MDGSLAWSSAFAESLRHASGAQRSRLRPYGWSFLFLTSSAIEEHSQETVQVYVILELANTYPSSIGCAEVAQANSFSDQSSFRLCRSTSPTS